MKNPASPVRWVKTKRRQALMKKMVSLFCALALLLGMIVPAGAEIVGYTGEWNYIHRYLAPNGQELFFVSSEQEPPVLLEDLNRDGTEDIVVCTAMGTSNCYVEFFVWDGEKYVMARHTGDALSNYTVTPSGYILSHGNSGWAGALFEERVYVWEGTNLRMVRKILSEQEETMTFGENSYTVSWNEDALHVCVWAYEPDGEGFEIETLLWETRLTLDALNKNPDLFDEMSSHLWDGLTP